MPRHRIVYSIVFYAYLIGGCLSASVDSSKECQTPSCIASVKSLKKLMDTSVSPCDNFYNFACGKFMKENEVKPPKRFIGTFTSLSDEDNKVMKGLLERPVEHKSKCSYEEKMKSLYKACMDMDAIEKRGLKDYKRSDRDDWPTLNSRWTDAGFSLQTAAEKYSKLFSYTLFSFSTLLDSEGVVRKKILQISQPDFKLYTNELLESRSSKRFKEFERYYTDVAVALGADKLTAAFDAKKVIDFIHKAGQYFMDSSRLGDPSETFNPMTLQEMNSRYPYLNWVSLVQQLYKAINPNIKISATQRVNIRTVPYLDGLATVLKGTDQRTIQNLFAFTHAEKMTKDATKQMRDLRFTFMENDNVTRSKHCVMVADDVYNRGMAKLMSKTRFSKKARTFMDGLIQNLKTSYNDSISALDWMEHSTKEEAFKKVNEMKTKIGIPRSKFGNKDLDLYYKNFEVTSHKMFIKDYLQNQRQAKIISLSAINKPLDSWRWPISLTMVNAYHGRSINTIVFPLGILQPPFFDQNGPSYMNYGSIGIIIGHEIGHGLDSSGRKYDEQGRIREWWTDDDEQKYTKKAKCYIDQYSSFVDDQINVRANGSLSQTENIADNMGMEAAFKAYKKYASSHPKELPLPELGLTNDQLFFLAFGQTFCTKNSDKFLKMILTSSSYVATKYRILGSMQNSKEFAKAYNCKKGDYMNPVNKCSMW